MKNGVCVSGIVEDNEDTDAIYECSDKKRGLDGRRFGCGKRGGGGATDVSPAGGVAATNAVGPKIQFATPVYDFGRVKAGEPVKYTYVFTNTGDGLLIINSVQPQCGCTATGEWTRQVEPGKTGNIPIQFNTAGYNGPVVKQVTVNCNVTNQTLVLLQIKGTVYKPVDLTPPMAVLNVMPDAERGFRGGDHHEQYRGAADAVWAGEQQPDVRRRAEDQHAGEGVPIDDFDGAAAGLGSVQGQITLRTGWTNPPTISVPAVANVQPAIMVVPSHITLAPGPLRGRGDEFRLDPEPEHEPGGVVRPGREHARGGGPD